MIRGCQRTDLLSFLLACSNCCCHKSHCGEPSLNSVRHSFSKFLKNLWLSLETLNSSPSTILLNRIAIDAASFIHFCRLSCKFLHRSCNSSMLRYRIFVVKSTEVLLSRPCDSDPLNRYVERFFLFFFYIPCINHHQLPDNGN